MNYIEIEIGGKKRGFRFGLKVIGDCIKHQDQDPEQFLVSLAKNPFEAVPVMLFYGAKYEVEKKGGIADFTLFDVYDWVEAEGLQSEMLDNVAKVFMRSLYDNVPAIKEALDKPENEDVKKSLIGTETS